MVITFLDGDELIKRKIKNEFRVNEQIVKEWQTVQYGEYKIRAID